MADSNVTSAAAALEPMRKPIIRCRTDMGIRTQPFVGAEALDALSDIACQPPKDDLGTGMEVPTHCKNEPMPLI